MIDGGLRPLFKKKLPGHWIAVESGVIAGGIPDSNYCIEGKEGWVEFKQTTAWAVAFRPLQIPLITHRIEAGGRVWIAVRRWKRRDGADELWMVHGSLARKVAESGLHKAKGDSRTRVLEGGPTEWPWVSVLACLVS